MLKRRPSRLRLLFAFAVLLAFIHLCRYTYRPVSESIGESIDTLSNRYNEWQVARKKERVQQAIAKQTKNLPPVDSAIVYVLGDAEQPEGSGFPIRPYKNDALILREAKITGKPAESLAEIWRTRSFGGGGALCHDPVYGLRMYSNGELVCETSICWHCMNCYLQLPENKYGWVGFGDENELLLNHLRSIIELPERTQAVIAVERAEGLYYESNFSGALEELAKAGRLNPSSAKVDYTRGRVLEKNGDPAGAIDAFSKAIEKSPEWPLPYVMRGPLLAAQGKHAEAVFDYTEALDNEDAGYWANVQYLLRLRAASYRALGDEQSADDDLAKSDTFQ